MDIALRIVGGLIGFAVGIAFLHLPWIGTVAGLFMMAGSLLGIVSPVMQKSSLYQVLAIFAALFFLVWKMIPHLRLLGPHHWHF
ncbi:MAG TPA: hypothetical protein VGO93_24520 [Candidatus Xenobia bacterium]